MKIIHLYIIRNTAREQREERIRAVLRKHYGTDIAQLPTLYKTEKGQPYLSDGSCVSITDSGSFWMMAVADVPIGIDLQLHAVGKGKRAGEDPLSRQCRKLAERFFHPEENEYVQNGCPDGSSEVEVIHRFFEVWTAKEAYVKYTGQGIDGTFSSFSVRREGMQELFRYPEVAENYTCCICSTQQSLLKVEWVAL